MSQMSINSQYFVRSNSREARTAKRSQSKLPSPTQNSGYENVYERQSSAASTPTQSSWNEIGEAKKISNPEVESQDDLAVVSTVFIDTKATMSDNDNDHDDGSSQDSGHVPTVTTIIHTPAYVQHIKQKTMSNFEDERERSRDEDNTSHSQSRKQRSKPKFHSLHVRFKTNEVIANNEQAAQTLLRPSQTLGHDGVNSKHDKSGSQEGSMGTRGISTPTYPNTDKDGKMNPFHEIRDSRYFRRNDRSSNMGPMHNAALTLSGPRSSKSTLNQAEDEHYYKHSQ
ncbi:hypothetical protein RFI_21101, partial [Reticulomyxa filosa]